MEFMLDTINLEAIRKYQKILPLAGVTSNPSIVKQAGKIDFFAQMKEIKKTIGQASLHVQVVGQTTEEMLEDAQTIVQQLGQETFIKIPVNEAGLAMPAIQKAVTDFQEDWVAVFGVETVNELA
ncbi:hypothetical protein KCT28_002570 [Enterococcus faecalis]|nr:hypothetical protein [Enterococcus faecalis]